MRSYVSVADRRWRRVMPRARRTRLLGTFALPFTIWLAAPGIAYTGAATYAYDALGRVVSVVYDTGVIVYYTYDANGNRLSQTVNVNTATLTWTATANPCTANCWGGVLW